MNGTPKNCTNCHYSRQCNSWYGGTGCLYRNKIVKHKRGNNMKKIVLFLLVVAVVLSVTVSAYAATPALKVPNMPKVPAIKVELKLSENFWSDYFAKNPINIRPLYPK